ncbi:MAG: DUF1508 domain-containing protein [Actinobacteria bacterium]|nr:DUF1508 domain-containing protein [Actinomycetota bacterium]MCA1721333.1 DUF1508 domain-containing protein [Actinomycetota bacterium]
MTTRLVYQRPDGGWSWRLTDGEGNVLAAAGAAYATEADARAAADGVVGGAFGGAARKVHRRQPGR